MQDRYAGDVGDFVKLGLLRALSPGRQLGVAWYRYPDEDHNGDGRHITYLDQPARYEHLDPALFRAPAERHEGCTLDHLASAGLWNGAISSDAPVASGGDAVTRSPWLAHRVVQPCGGATLSPCDLVFADPDNGIIDDGDQRRGPGEVRQADAPGGGPGTRPWAVRGDLPSQHPASRWPRR
jgi:hypothetical protein